MSAPQRIAKLESLLERVQKNRRPAPAPITLGGAAARAPVEAPRAAVVEPPRSVTPPRPVPAPELELVEAAPAELEAVPRPPKPTPMEMALEVELESRPEPSMEVEISVDEGPEITIDHDDELEEAIPTAPVETRSPEPEPLAARPVALETASSAAPVARVVSAPRRAEPTTFGELLDRTLSLRPR